MGYVKIEYCFIVIIVICVGISILLYMDFIVE